MGRVSNPQQPSWGWGPSIGTSRTWTAFCGSPISTGRKDGLTQSISSFAGIFALLKLAALAMGLIVLYNLGVLNYSEEER